MIPRFRVYSLANSGVAATRNRGLELARGKYVAFLDQDDGYHPRFLEEMLRHAQAHDADCVVSAFQTVHTPEEMEAFRATVFQPSVAKLIVDPLSWVLLPKRDLANVWQKLWKVSVLQGVRFNPEIYGADDALFTWEAFINFSRVAWTETPLYGYRMHRDNVTSQAPSCYALAKCRILQLLCPEVPPSHRKLFRKAVMKHLSAVVKDYCRQTYTEAEHRSIIEAIRETLRVCDLSPLRWSPKKLWRYFCYCRRWPRALPTPSES